MSNPEGRRIYVARNALRKSVSEHGGAYAVSYALAATRGARIVSHNLIDPFNNPGFGLVREPVARRIVGNLVEAREGTLDDYLKRTGYVPNRPRRAEPILPLFGSHETTYATCYDSENNWYTVATSAAAADRMWRDFEPAESLLERLRVSTADLPDDLRDLTVITAEDDLFPVAVSPDGTYQRAPDSNTAGLGSRREARTIDEQTRESYLRYLGSVGLKVFHEMLEVEDPFTEDETRVLVDTFTACRSSLQEYASY